jgi:hypothetical protein
MSSTEMDSTEQFEIDSTEQFESGLAELKELADRHITTLQAVVAGLEPAAAVDLLKRVVDLPGVSEAE